ncbi:hypothetical protein [Aquicella siphonis]|uniref:hypothetical protein n=1 Tax=Aquicella siphonis TaxID=254247 RepID=UPI0011DDE307|nr:hypothetical protein [Aquicella siphonis]
MHDQNYSTRNYILQKMRDNSESKHPDFDYFCQEILVAEPACCPSFCSGWAVRDGMLKMTKVQYKKYSGAQTESLFGGAAIDYLQVAVRMVLISNKNKPCYLFANI